MRTVVRTTGIFVLSCSAWTQCLPTSLPILLPLNWGQSLILRTRGVKNPAI